ncbi:unnamed protein product [Arabis nemorensis]|uniref:Uncharacterized protein n=1 Tax=Arabis nemorensis TaxID=586526 RepID=A0A565CLV3_9BRAS|nr:unnamed protein product [Arabis nemorensis]
METESDRNDDATITVVKDMRARLENRIRTQHDAHLDLLSSLQSIVPDIFCEKSDFSHSRLGPANGLTTSLDIMLGSSCGMAHHIRLLGFLAINTRVWHKENLILIPEDSERLHGGS